MNFFKLYIGDYQRDTGALSLAEHGAYMLMLQHYYATEKPLPIGKALHRMLRAQDKAERDAIDTVATQFWTTTEAGLINERADIEITKAGAQADTNARIAREREARRKASREQHEESTNRATNDQPNQTPDTIDTSPDGDVGKTALAVVAPNCPQQQIIDLYHRLLPMGRQVRDWTPARGTALRARWRDKPARQKLEWWERFFAYCAESDFLTGKVYTPGRRPFELSLDWLVKAENMAKVIEGAYENEKVAA